MSMPVERLPFPPLLSRLAGVLRVLRDRGALFYGAAHLPAVFAAPAGRGQVSAQTLREPHLALFVARLRQLLAAGDERTRRRLEQDVLDLAVPLQATGLFEVMHIAHPPLAAMVADHLASTSA